MTVTLSGIDDLGNAVSVTTTTGGGGFYSFNGLRPGSYSITETQPGAYLDGRDSIGSQGGSTSNDAFSAINLGAGVTGINNNFGELLPASLSGYVYNDVDNNGVFDASEAGISGVRVALTGTDDQGNSVSLSTTTSADGLYSFGNLRPGTYTVTETQPAAYLDGQDTIGTPGGVTSNDRFSSIALGAGVDGQNNNFGEVLASSISGYVYYDANNDGSFGGSDAAISGATVTLSGIDDRGITVSQTATTNAAGYYIFSNLRPGTYSLTETQPAGYIDGIDTIGNLGGTTTNDRFSGIALPTGTNGISNNFGETLSGSISGYVYCDMDNNGLKSTTESGIGGVTVTITGVNDLGASVTFTTVTASNGAYAFTGLRPGTYTLRETQPANTTDGLDRAGSLGGIAGNDVISSIVLRAGQSGTNYLFGEICQGEIRGTKYQDLTGNGLSSDDVGMGGVRVYLDVNNNGVWDSTERSTITGSNGTYAFSGLSAGNYIVREVVPTGYVRTFPTLADNYCVALGIGASVTGLDFANYQCCTCTLTGVSFTINHTDGTSATVTNLRGNTNQGDEVIATFTVPAGQTERITLVSYTAPGPSFNAAVASEQRIFEVDSAVFGPGVHTLRVHNPDSNYQVDFVCDEAIVQFGPAGSNIFYSAQHRLFSADNDGTTAVIVGAGKLSGNAYLDANNNGVFESTESGLAGVTIKLTYTDNGTTTTITKKTDSRGFYQFSNLKPGLSYTINESQPVTLLDGIDSVGSLGGNTSVNDRFSAIAVGTNASGINYNFGERVVTGNCVSRGDTCSSSFWNCTAGQNLIKACNGGSTSTSLGNWLAANFPSLFGASAGTSNLTGKTNAQVAAFFKTRFSAGSTSPECQILTCALTVYCTSSNLCGGTYAASCGFRVTAAGCGSSIVTPGSCGSTFGVSSSACLTLLQCLTIANNNCSNNGTAWYNNTSARNNCNSVFTSANSCGGIS